MYLFSIKVKNIIIPDVYRITEIQGKYYIYNPRKKMFLDAKGAYSEKADQYYYCIKTLEDALKIIELVDP